MSTTPAIRSRTTAADYRSLIEEGLRYHLGTVPARASRGELFCAAALAVRRRLIDGLIATEAAWRKSGAKRVYYLSMEFLMGRSLENTLRNLGQYDAVRSALESLGADLREIFAEEPDAALGNGGLGRLAACFLDSLATLGLPGFGYGINYEFGLFRQEIENGMQREKPDHWASAYSPWLIERVDEAYLIPVYGRIEHTVDRAGAYNPMWVDWKLIVGVPHDMPIAGYGGETVNYLRLFSARSSDEFDTAIFNSGDYIRAVQQKIESETVSKVLYPSDAVASGRELRLLQEYFLVACALRDIVGRYTRDHGDITRFADKVAIQLNDTHPALAVAELMRVLVDEHSCDWDQAWDITRAAFAYTNHTLMPEALEKWPLELMERVLPRHLQIVYEINRRFLESVAARFLGDVERLRRMSLIEEGAQKQVRMAHLAIVGSHSVNGVAALHSELLKRDLVPDFYAMFPERFNNKTNGVTPRRWLSFANPGLSEWISRRIGSGWLRDLEHLRALEPYAESEEAVREFLEIKRVNKNRLAREAFALTGVRIDSSALFDVQAKRIHEYKRQLLHALQVIHEYLQIVEDGRPPRAPRVHIFAGKAAPGYYLAKQIIWLINSIATRVNADPRAKGHLQAVFLPDYRVSLAEIIIPAADLSEQISTAGTEASGTSNMKFAMNGALTIGTLDGANIEMREAIGDENMFIFGLTAEQVAAARASGYSPWSYYHGDSGIRRVIDSLVDGHFARDREAFRSIHDTLLANGDQYLHLADFGSYAGAQERASELYLDPRAWARKTVLNVARMGRFSSDRTIQQYAAEIWSIQPA